VTDTAGRLGPTSGVDASPRGGPPGAGIVHLGLGSFHRAHQAVYTARSIDLAGGAWGIVGVAHRNPVVARLLQRQGGRYSVLELGPAGPRASVIGVHDRVLVGTDSPDEVARAIADPRTRIVTLTITEQGYTFTPGTRRLDTSRPGVASDLDGHAPRTALGLLVAGLRLRHQRGAGPIAIVSCDNITGNGPLLRGLVMDFLDRQATRLRAGPPDWVADEVAFPSTMVDRIVPRTTDEHRDLAARLLGTVDAAVVPAEPYSMWVVEDDFPGGRPAWDLAGARMSDEVERYEWLKLGLLNATHSLAAYLGLLAGVETIAGAVAVPAIRSAAQHLMDSDIGPTLLVPRGVDAAAYGREVLERFDNPHTGHTVRQVASDGATKLPQRVGRPCRMALARGTPPAWIALLVAAYLRAMVHDAATSGGAPDLDPEQPLVLAALAAGQPVGVIADSTLARTGILPADVEHRQDFLDLVADLYGVLARGGVAAAVRDAMAASNARHPGALPMSPEPRGRP
jgi:fructuronate reductase